MTPSCLVRLSSHNESEKGINSSYVFRQQSGILDNERKLDPALHRWSVEIQDQHSGDFMWDLTIENLVNATSIHFSAWLGVKGSSAVIHPEFRDVFGQRPWINGLGRFGSDLSQAQELWIEWLGVIFHPLRKTEAKAWFRQYWLTLIERQNG